MTTQTEYQLATTESEMKEELKELMTDDQTFSGMRMYVNQLQQQTTNLLESVTNMIGPVDVIVKPLDISLEDLPEYCNLSQSRDTDTEHDLPATATQNETEIKHEAITTTIYLIFFTNVGNVGR